MYFKSNQNRAMQMYALSLAKAILIMALIIMALATSSRAANHRDSRVKRSLYELPDGAEFLISSSPEASDNNGNALGTGSASESTSRIRTTFSCDGLGYGYYADPDNDCKIFHICQSFRMSDGSIYNNHWSFICGNQTVFNQVTLSCSHPEDAVPCENAKDFYHVNDYFGDLQAPSVKQSDLQQAQELVSSAYGSRLSVASVTSTQTPNTQN